MNYLQEILGYTENDNKVCVKCGESKHITEFGHRAFNKGDIPQTYNFCKSCGKIQASALRKMKKHVPFPDEHYECPGCNLTEQQILDEFSTNVSEDFHQVMSSDSQHLQPTQVTVMSEKVIKSNGIDVELD